MIEHRQRVTLVDRAAHVDGQVLDDAGRPRHDVDLLVRLHRTRIAENRADWPDPDGHGPDNQTAAAWRAALLCFGCLRLDEQDRAQGYRRGEHEHGRD